MLSQTARLSLRAFTCVDGTRVQMLKKRHRLKSRLRIQQVRSSRPSWTNCWLVLTKLLSEQESTRFAFSVGRRVGNAVTRNHIKRLLAESVQKRLAEIKGTWDIVLIARQPAGQASFTQIDCAVADLFTRANLLPESDQG